MAPEPPSVPPLDPWGWLALRHAVAATLIVFCLWVSIGLIVRMWLVHRGESFIHELIWTFFLLVPLFGWVFYAGLFRVPELHDAVGEAGANQWVG